MPAPATAAKQCAVRQIGILPRWAVYDQGDPPFYCNQVPRIYRYNNNIVLKVDWIGPGWIAKTEVC